MKFKYENKNPFECLEEGEPWFFLRAKDVFSLATLEFYAGKCREIGLRQNVKEIMALRDLFKKFQQKHGWRIPKAANPPE